MDRHEAQECDRRSLSTGGAVKKTNWTEEDQKLRGIYPTQGLQAAIDAFPHRTPGAVRMSKFTRGPWYIDHAVDSKGADEYRYVFSPRGDLGAFIAKIRLSPWPKEQEANAHLIAAAPELYETLAWLDRKGGLGLDVHKTISAVLAKARGEA